MERGKEREREKESRKGVAKYNSYMMHVISANIAGYECSIHLLYIYIYIYTLYTMHYTIQTNGGPKRKSREHKLYCILNVWLV